MDKVKHITMSICYLYDFKNLTIYSYKWAFLMAQMVKNLLAMQKMWIQPLGQGDPLEKGMSPFSSMLAWRIPWTEDPGELQSTVLQRVGHD